METCKSLIAKVKPRNLRIGQRRRRPNIEDTYSIEQHFNRTVSQLCSRVLPFFSTKFLNPHHLVVTLPPPHLWFAAILIGSESLISTNAQRWLTLLFYSTTEHNTTQHNTQQHTHSDTFTSIRSSECRSKPGRTRCHHCWC